MKSASFVDLKPWKHATVCYRPQWKRLSLITACFNIICMFFLKPHWSSCFCQQEAGANVPLQSISTCMCDLHISLQKWNRTITPCSNQIQTTNLCLCFWSMLNLNQFSRYCSLNCSTKRKDFILNCTALHCHVPFYSPFPSTVSLLLSLSLFFNSPQHEIFPPQVFVDALQLLRKRSHVSISGLHSHVHHVLASMYKCLCTHTWHQLPIS